MDLRRGDPGDQAHQCGTAGPAQGDRITLPALGTRLLSPDPTLVSGWDRAILQAEELAGRVVQRGRAGIDDALGPLLHEGAAAATALLSAGRREPARALIRLLSRSAVTGTLPDSATRVPARLVEAFALWTGDLEFLAKYRVSGPTRVVREALGDTAGAGREERGGTAGAGREALGGTGFAAIDSIILGVWGLTPHAVEEQLAMTLRPAVESGEMALTGLRVGRTTLALRYRRRPGQVVLRCAITRGPALRLSATLGGTAAVTAVTIDEEPVGRARAMWRATGEHEVVFELEA